MVLTAAGRHSMMIRLCLLSIESRSRPCRIVSRGPPAWKAHLLVVAEPGMNCPSVGAI